MKKIIVILVVAILVIGGFVIFRNKSNKNNNLMQMQYERVKREDIRVSISATGVVKPELSANISPEAEQRGAKIISLKIKEGDFVKKGDVIAELDKSASLAALKAAEANFKAAKAQLDLLLEGTRKEDIEKAEAFLNSAKSKHLDAKQNYQRVNDLYEKGFISDKEIELAKMNLNVAENDVRQAEAQLKILKIGSREKEIERQRAIVEQAQANYEQAKANYDSTIIYSPISGIVTSKLMEEGQIAYPNSIIAKITDLKTLQIIADIDETDIGKVKVGDLAEISFEALPEVKLNGIVLRISPEAKLKQDITCFEVTIELKDIDERVKPGMTADVDIIFKEKQSALVVSSTAVKRGKMGEYIVLHKGKDKFIPKVVEIGIKTQDKYEILDGLKEGDTIVGNYALLKKEERQPTGIFGPMRGPGRQGRTGRIRSVGPPPPP